MNDAPITNWLDAWKAGDLAARDRLVEALLPRLRAVALGVLQRYPQAASLFSPTVLVNETYLRLSQQHEHPISDREHFFALATRMMNNAVIDQLRRLDYRETPATPTELERLSPVAGRTTQDRSLDVLGALRRFALEYERQAQVLLCKLYDDLTLEQIAERLGVSLVTVRRDLAFALAWMQRELAPQDDP